MIGKIISGTSFASTVGYVMKEHSRILAVDGVTPPDVRDMVRDFKDQTLLNPRLKNTVGHISLSFSEKDADRLSDATMTNIAAQYMKRMGICNTQYLVVRHNDQPHPHCHIVYNRVGNNGQTITDSNIKLRNIAVCKELTSNHGLYFSTGKAQVRRERLREPDKTKYRIFDAIKNSLPGCRSWDDLEQQLQRRGIATTFKYCGETDRRQGVLFGRNGYTFSGSKIDRAFSFSRLDNYFVRKQFIEAAATPPSYSEKSVTVLADAAGSYRSSFYFLHGTTSGDSEIKLGSFGVRNTLPISIIDLCGCTISPEQMQRRIGEAPEEHIARITALVRQATEAMHEAIAEQERRMRERKRQIRM